MSSSAAEVPPSDPSQDRQQAATPMDGPDATPSWWITRDNEVGRKWWVRPWPAKSGWGGWRRRWGQGAAGEGSRTGDNDPFDPDNPHATGRGRWWDPSQEKLGAQLPSVDRNGVVRGFRPPPNPFSKRMTMVATSAANQLLLGAVLLKAAQSLCRPSSSESDHSSSATVTSVLYIATALLSLSMILESVSLPMIGFGNPGGQGIVRLLQGWILLLAIVLIAAVAHRRALAIHVAWPRGKIVTNLATFAFLICAIATRIMSTYFEVISISRQTSPFQTIFARQIARTIVNIAAALYVLYMEGFVTAIIFFYHEGHATRIPRTSMLNEMIHASNASPGSAQKAGARSMGQSKKNQTATKWRRRFCGTPNARLRVTYAVLLSCIFLAQAILQSLNFWGITFFSPFYTMGWTCFLIRLYEFRIELETNRPTMADLHQPSLCSEHPLASARLPQTPRFQSPVLCPSAGPGRPQPDATHRFDSAHVLVPSSRQQMEHQLSTTREVSAGSSRSISIVSSSSPNSSNQTSPQPHSVALAGINRRGPTVSGQHRTTPTAAAVWDLLHDIANQRWEGNLHVAGRRLTNHSTSTSSSRPSSVSSQ